MEVELGVRPLDLEVFEGERPAGSVELTGRVYVVERLGRELEVTIRVGENLIAVVTEGASHETDELVKVCFPAAKALLFESGTGERMDLRQGVEA
jgi:ABC-type sugar transport system ATPase subunit